MPAFFVVLVEGNRAVALVMLKLQRKRMAKADNLNMETWIYMDAIAHIEQIIQPSLAALGYSLVQIKLMDGKRKTLSIMAERLDDMIMGFDDCVEITGVVSALLDVEEPVSGAYSLEVCSPGLDRPLVQREDYRRFAGNEIKAETIIPLNGRKRFRGNLLGIESDVVSIDTSEGKFALPYSHIRSAKLVMSDEWVAKFLKKQTEKQYIKKTKTKNERIKS